MDERKGAMEDLGIGPSPSFWRGKRVLVTGHSGFIGSWLSLALIEMGAKVTGLSLPPPTTPSHFEAVGLSSQLDHHLCDLRDAAATAEVLAAARPELVFHLAAQALVRQAFADPATTFATNVIGTVNLLEAIRQGGSVSTMVAFTTDKVYANREWCWPYRETDALGGREPYGSSKAACEHVLEAYRHSYFAGPDRVVGMAAIRAGNVIGGGDWAADRLIPDAVRAFASGAILEIRNPHSVRPWQHVLEPVGAAMLLAERLAADRPAAEGGWNIGPDDEDTCPVSRIADLLATSWKGDAKWTAVGGQGPYEASRLILDSHKFQQAFGWRRRWSLPRAVDETGRWYRGYYRGEQAAALSRKQIESYFDGR